MLTKPTRITIFLLIALLLTTSLDNAFGVVACESGIFSETHKHNHHTDEHKDNLPEGYEVFYTQHLTDHGDTCHDYLTQLSKGVYKEAGNVTPPKADTVKSAYASLPNPDNFYFIVLDTYLKPPLITPRAILAHRTVVLLN